MFMVLNSCNMYVVSLSQICLYVWLCLIIVLGKTLASLPCILYISQKPSSQ